MSNDTRKAYQVQVIKETTEQEQEARKTRGYEPLPQFSATDLGIVLAADETEAFAIASAGNVYKGSVTILELPVFGLSLTTN